MTDQTHEIDFDDLTMEHPREVTRVIQFWEQDVPSIVSLTDGDFRMYFTETQYGIRRIQVIYDSGFTFDFQVYNPTNDPVEAIRQFNEFIERNSDTASEWMLNNN
mgnify:CR=1 FL=1